MEFGVDYFDLVKQGHHLLSKILPRSTRKISTVAIKPEIFIGFSGRIVHVGKTGQQGSLWGSKRKSLLAFPKATKQDKCDGFVVSSLYFPYPVAILSWDLLGLSQYIVLLPAPICLSLLVITSSSSNCANSPLAKFGSFSSRMWKWLELGP